MNSKYEAIIVGGGLAGLTCAHYLTRAGCACLVLEANNSVGGRVATDSVDGFLLDRGFQVMLTAYPEAQAVLDYDALQLCPFEPGALVRLNGRFHRFADPWRRPQHALSTALSPVGTVADKLRVARFRSQTREGTLEDTFSRPERSTLEHLRAHGFSERVMDRFFKPFLGGVFLDSELRTSSRFCEFVFRMFASGDAALPSGGMGEIPCQIASNLPSDVVRTDHRVERITACDVVLDSGQRISGRTVVVATEAPAAYRLLGINEPADQRSVTCLYFAAPRPPIAEPILVLNGDGRGPINNLCVPSQVAPAYAPQGQSLVSTTVLGTPADLDLLLDQVVAQLVEWFGPNARNWRHLKTYAIPYALPAQTSSPGDPRIATIQTRENLFVCGDYCDTASINGAISSGRCAAEAVINSLHATQARPDETAHD